MNRLAVCLFLFLVFAAGATHAQGTTVYFAGRVEGFATEVGIAGVSLEFELQLVPAAEWTARLIQPGPPEARESVNSSV